MSERKLVSVVCGTYNRHQLVLEMVENVRAQSYRPIELCIVADGPDPELYALIVKAAADGMVGQSPERVVLINFKELGFHSSSLLSNSISAAPFLVAQLLARGAYQVWLADDERFLEPDALEQMIDLMEEQDLDWVYPQVLLTWPNSSRTRVIGTDPPTSGQFTHCAYRQSMLDRGMLFRTHVGAATDWDCAQRSMASGSRWGFIEKVLLQHRVDK